MKEGIKNCSFIFHVTVLLYFLNSLGTYWQPVHNTDDVTLLQASAPQQKPVTTATANRKAAIERFRAKRTQRSFEKKVRYTSRQRLAENRPRLKGQFVKASSQSGDLTEASPSTEMNSGNSDEAQL